MNAVITRSTAAFTATPRLSLPVIAGIALAGLLVSTWSLGDAPSLDSASETAATPAAAQPSVRIVKHAHRATPVLVMVPAKA